MRQGAASVLGDIDSRDSVSALIAVLGDSTVAMNAVEALSRSKAAVMPLIDLLGQRVAHLRRLAAWALGPLRDRRAVPALVRRLDDADPEVRKIVALTLGQIGDPRGEAAVIR